MNDCKPDGTVSLLAGVSPGAHWQPGDEHYMRIMQYGKDDPILQEARDSGYRVEPSAYLPDTTSVVYYPMKRPSGRGEHDVPLLTKYHLAALCQRHWSDNGVSVTLSFRPEEADQIPCVLELARGTLKAASFLPIADGVYEQMPYTSCSEDDVVYASERQFAIDTDVLYNDGIEAKGEKFCTNDSCAI